MSLILKLLELHHAHSRCSGCFGGYVGNVKQWETDEVCLGLQISPLKEEAK